MPEASSGIPQVREVSLSALTTRPDLFQNRERRGKEDYDDALVKDIVKNFDATRFDPIEVAENPDKQGEYIVLSGHHRREVAKRMELDKVPIRIIPVDINDPESRQKAEEQALLSLSLIHI